MSAFLDEIKLPDQALWDYWASGWTPVQTTESRAQSGRRVVQRGVKIGGRPVVIDRCWADYATVQALEAALTRESMVLAWHNGQTYPCEWDHGNRPFVAEPIIDYTVPESGDWYALTLRLIFL
ncbi:hypothetical protein MYXO_00253 [Myxococcaceae bacterium]|nr:hypothetical protein MYXO_00253 [Myxococcaceae bacterium]